MDTDFLDTNYTNFHEYFNRQDAKDANGAKLTEERKHNLTTDGHGFFFLNANPRNRRNPRFLVTAKTPRTQRRPEGIISREEREGQRGFKAKRNLTTDGHGWTRIFLDTNYTNFHEYFNRQDAKDANGAKLTEERKHNLTTDGHGFFFLNANPRNRRNPRFLVSQTTRNLVAYKSGHRQIYSRQ